MDIATTKPFVKVVVVRLIDTNIGVKTLCESKRNQNGTRFRLVNKNNSTGEWNMIG